MEEEVVGMGNVISSLTTTVSADNLWAVVGSAVPLIGVCVIFGLGFVIVRRLLQGARNRGKVKM